MQIGENAEALEIPMDFMGRSGGPIHPVVLWNALDGVTLVDTGMPDQLPVFEEKLAGLGLSLRSVRRILLTHQDLDHIGSAGAIAEATGAEIYAHAAEAPFIQGELPLLKLDPKRLQPRIDALPAESRARARRLLLSPPKVKVDHLLGGGEELPFHGGIVVIPTPGHSPGHVCYYLKAQRLLLAGDALRFEGGSIIGPSPMATPDMRRAVASLRNLLPYRIDAVLCYHGGLTRNGVAARLRDLTRIGG